MRVDALGLLANKTVARIADKVVPCGRAFNYYVLECFIVTNVRFSLLRVADSGLKEVVTRFGASLIIN